MGSKATRGQKVPQWVEDGQSTALEIMEKGPRSTLEAEEKVPQPRH